MRRGFALMAILFPVKNSVIVVRSNHIETVGRQGEVSIPANAHAISTAGSLFSPA